MSSSLRVPTTCFEDKAGTSSSSQLKLVHRYHARGHGLCTYTQVLSYTYLHTQCYHTELDTQEESPVCVICSNLLKHFFLDLKECYRK